MEKLKKLLDRIFIDGLTGMAQDFCNIDRRHNYSADWKFDWRECRGYDFVLGRWQPHLRAGSWL